VATVEEAQRPGPAAEPDPAATATAVRAARKRRAALAYSLLGAACFLVLWHLGSQFTRTQFQLLPSPLAVVGRMWDYVAGDELAGIPPGTVVINFWDTFRKTLIGFAGAMIVGIPVGILMGRYRYAKNFFFDFVYIAANVPLIVYAILGLMLFGLGDTGPAVVVGLLVLPTIALNVAAGVEGIDRNLLTMSQAYDVPRSATLRHVVTPSFAPYLFAGARSSFAASWKLATLAETFGGSTGVGVQIRKAFQGFSVTDMLAWMMFFVAFVVLIERFVLMRLERRVFRFRLRRNDDVLRY
jgi:NitT/TauT family transport system permease protein